MKSQLFDTFLHLWALLSKLYFPLIFHFLWLFCHFLSHVTCYVPRQQPQPQTFPCWLPHYPQWTGSRSKKALTNHGQKRHLNCPYFWTDHAIFMAFFRILSFISNHSTLWRNTKIWYFGRYWQLQLLWHTDRQRDIATLWPTQPGGPSRWKYSLISESTIFLTVISHLYFVPFLPAGTTYYELVGESNG